MITVSGRTFAISSQLKTWGGRFDGNSKQWTFEFLYPHQINRLRSLVGVLVTETAAEPEHSPLQPVFKRPDKTLCVGDDMEFLGTFRDDNPMVFFGFSSLGAFVDHVAGLEPPTAPGTSDAAWRTGDQSAEWAGTESLNAAIQLARKGWTEGFGLASVFDIPHALNKRRTHSLAGGSVNVGRMLAGNPAHMVRRVPQPKHKQITLFIETMMWRGITAESAMLRAILIAGVVDVLETEGYRCTIIATACDLSMRDQTAQSQLAVRIKDAGERLNLLDLSFSLGHPSFLRRLNHAALGVHGFLDLPEKGMGYVSEAFDDDHTPPRNSYYFAQLPAKVIQSEYIDPMNMLRYILPDDLPIKIQGLT